jgi:hypothetical protein
MIHNMQISDTTAVAWAIVGAMTLVATYITGYSRARRKAEKEIYTAHRGEEEAQERTSVYERVLELSHKRENLIREKYNTLQQEIECHIHEVHEGVERPHVEKTWPVDKKGRPVTDKGYQDYVSEADEEQIWQEIAAIGKQTDNNIDHRQPGAGC